MHSTPENYCIYFCFIYLLYILAPPPPRPCNFAFFPVPVPLLRCNANFRNRKSVGWALNLRPNTTLIVWRRIWSCSAIVHIVFPQKFKRSYCFDFFPFFFFFFYFNVFFLCFRPFGCRRVTYSNFRCRVRSIVKSDRVGNYFSKPTDNGYWKLNVVLEKRIEKKK